MLRKSDAAHEIVVRYETTRYVWSTKADFNASAERVLSITDGRCVGGAIEAPAAGDRGGDARRESREWHAALSRTRHHWERSQTSMCRRFF